MPPANYLLRALRHSCRASWLLLPFLANTVDLGFECVELIVGPRSLGDEGHHHLPHRAAEEGMQVLLQGVPFGDGGRDRRGVDISETVLLVFQAALPLQPREHDANGRIAWRFRQTRANFLSGRAITQRKKGIHDLPFPPCQSLGDRFGHRHCPASELRATPVTSYTRHMSRVKPNSIGEYWTRLRCATVLFATAGLLRASQNGWHTDLTIHR